MRRRTLLLLRHAEAAPAKLGQRDSERRLTARGRAHAEKVGKELARRNLAPELAVTSDARRAVETLTLVVRELDRAPRELVVPELYDAEKCSLLAWLRRSGGAAETILIVGHNPSIEEFAAWTTQQGDARSVSPFHSGYPPAALTVCDLHAGAWAEFEPRRAELRLFFVPDHP